MFYGYYMQMLACMNDTQMPMVRIINTCSEYKYVSDVTA